MGKQKQRIVIQNLSITGYAAGGKAVAHDNGKVIFVTGAIPGDSADILITKNKKDWAEGTAISIITPSPERLIPFCRHFGVCGGCKWQMLPYALQLQYKLQEVQSNFEKIGKVPIPDILPIIGSDLTKAYRNKLEFTFSNKRYLTTSEIGSDREILQQNALGYHAPNVFDKVLDISECWLMDDVNNTIRNTVREISILNHFTHYDIRQHTGWLRNIIIRLSTTGELMVNICINYENEPDLKILMDGLLEKVPSITTLVFTINPKWNDSIYDLTPQVYFGSGYITETLGNFRFLISPKSFFQTNTYQAEKLYKVVQNFACLTGKEIVYDLYCGTGSIGIFLSTLALKIIGVETIGEAVEDARKNAELNNINHAEFFSGDVIKVCNSNFFTTHGRPDVVITDPPRAGMHQTLIDKLLEITPPRIVYVSCNTATQARDIQLLSEKYTVEKIQPVDMFPHTHHIECVVALTAK